MVSYNPLDMAVEYLETASAEQVRYVLVAMVLTMWLLKSGVSFLNVSNLDQPLDPLMNKLYGQSVLQKYEKHKEYIRASNTFKEISGVYMQVLTFVAWFAGLYPFTDYFVKSHMPGYSDATHGTVCTLVLTILSTFVGLPLSYYQAFVLEERFGFNRMTLKTFIKDNVKSLLLIIAIGGLVFYCMFWIMSNYPIEKYWWLLVVFQIAFQLVMLILQPWIMKLFLEFITIERGVGFVTRGKAEKHLKNRYFYPCMDADKNVVENQWETRDAQFKGDKGATLVLRKTEESGLWVMEEKDQEKTYATANASVAAPEMVKEWVFVVSQSEDEGSAEASSSTKAASSDEALLGNKSEEEDDEENKHPLWLKRLDMDDMKTRLESMAEEHNFKFQAVYIIDGSTRSEHSNAFFMGFWWFRKICLFDTLLKNQSVDSICGVLGHEMGHCVMKHIPRQMIFGIVQTAFIFWCISLFIYNKALHGAFFVDTSNPNNITAWIGLQAVQVAMSPIFFWLGIVGNWLTRRYEYQADEFAVLRFKKNYGQDLINGLKDLAKENKSHLNPHPLYVTMNHSHPTLTQRVRWICSLSEQREGKDIIKLDQ